MIIYNIQTNGPCNQLIIELINDAVYVEPSMIAYVTGSINLETKDQMPSSFKTFWLSKDYFKAKLQGTGKIYLRAALGTYHKFTLKNDEEMVINPRAFIACRESVHINPRMNISLLNFLTGIPLFDKTVKGNGTGNVMVLMPGPVEEIVLKDEKFIAFEQEVAGYSAKLLSTREIVGKNWATGPRMARVFRGTGSVFFCPIPNKDAQSRISK